ncbi:MAG TPA: hypothetical protein VET69_12830 [Terriglobales bacterium]|nr:hypothetical protein [Terriglobales bacterium]
MTILLLLLLFVAAIAAGLGAALWWIYRPGPQTLSPELLAGLLQPRRSALEVYRPMNRLFAEEDFRFISAARPQMVRRLRRQRARVLRLYLRDLQAGFARVQALCRSLAPRSQDPNFAGLITRQALTFYGLLLMLRLRCALGWYLHVRVDTVDLVRALDQLTQAAQATLAGLAPQTALAGSPA